MTSRAGTAAQIERRRTRRYPHGTLVEIDAGADPLSGRVQNVSRDGLFIALITPLAIGTRFSAKWHLSEPVRIECVVRRVSPGMGMGVSFSVPDSSARDRVFALLDRLSSR